MPACGCSWSAVCPRGVFLAARSDTHPRCLWIFNIKTAKLVTVIVQLEVIVQSVWSNSTESSILAFIGQLCHKVYFWCDTFRLDPSLEVTASQHVKLHPSMQEQIEGDIEDGKPVATPILSANLSGTQLSNISDIKWNISSPIRRTMDGKNLLSTHQLILLGRDGCCEMDLTFEH